MDKFYVLKHKNGKYYSDGEFIEPEKKFAQKLRLGQAKSIKQNKDRSVEIISRDWSHEMRFYCYI